MAIKINNKRVSDLPWDSEAELDTGLALRKASKEVIGEAYCYPGGDGQEPLGLHHEFADNSSGQSELVPNRDAVYGTMMVLRQSPGSEQNEAPPLAQLRRADRIAAMEHLQRHARALEQM